MTETVQLALLTCDWTSYVWFEMLDLQIERARVSTLGNWLEMILQTIGVKGEGRKEVLKHIAYSMWYMWKGRNEATFHCDLPSIDSVISRAEREINEYHLSQKI